MKKPVTFFKKPSSI